MLLQLARGDRPLFAGAQQAAQHLLPVEALAAAVFLHHHVGDLVDALVGGEAPVAALALPPPPDRVGLLALARVHHPILPETAIRTLHDYEDSKPSRRRLRVRCSGLPAPINVRRRLLFPIRCPLVPSFPSSLLLKQQRPGNRSSQAAAGDLLGLD